MNEMEQRRYLGTLFDTMAENWKVFRRHFPVGAYLPLGQLDGDCKECHEEWPCSTVRKVMGPDE